MLMVLSLPNSITMVSTEYITTGKDDSKKYQINASVVPTDSMKLDWQLVKTLILVAMSRRSSFLTAMLSHLAIAVIMMRLARWSKLASLNS